jgi:hypothetical protein
VANDVVTVTRARLGMAAVKVVMNQVTIPFSYKDQLEAVCRVVTS